MKGHIAINFWGGIVACAGPDVGKDHDKRLWDEQRHEFPTEEGEWGLGDLAYEACCRILTARKHPAAGTAGEAWSYFDEFYKNLIAHYRSRVEIVIKKLKSHAWCANVFRGRKDLFYALFNITKFATATEIRLDFEVDKKVMFEVVGPWPHQFYP